MCFTLFQCNTWKWLLYLVKIFMLRRTVMKRSYWEDRITKQSRTIINLLTQRHSECRKQQQAIPFMWGVNYSFHVTGCAAEEVTFTSTSRDHVLLRGLCCHMQSLLPVQLQTIAKISIETARVRETPAGTEAYGWIIYDDFVVLLLVSEVCVCVCVCVRHVFMIPTRDSPSWWTWPSGWPERDQEDAKARHQTHPCMSCYRRLNLDIQFAKFQSKAFSAPLSMKEAPGDFFSSDNRGKQLL